MFNASFDKVNDLISPAKNIAIVVDRNPSLDSMASALSLSLALEKMGKKTAVFSETVATVGLGNLVGVANVKQLSPQVGGSSNGLVISLPYEQGAIEKISYDIVGDRINLTVVPGASGLNFSTEDINFQTQTQSYDLIITVGMASEPILPFDADGTLPLLNIDYKPDNTGYGTLAIIDEGYNSYSEMIAKMLGQLQLPMDADIAQNLLAGIVDITDNFQNAQTSAVAFETAAFLMQKGAQRRVVSSPQPVSQQANQPKPQQMQRDFQPQAFPKQDKRGSRPHQWQQPKVNRQPQPQAPRFATSGQADAAKQPPKDWFEPKIYRGSTPIS